MEESRYSARDVLGIVGLALMVLASLMLCVLAFVFLGVQGGLYTTALVLFGWGCGIFRLARGE